MTSLSISEARDNLGDLVNRALYTGERFIINRQGKPAAVLVPIEDAALLAQLEDRIDLAASRRAMKEGGPNIPWEEAKKDFGL